MVEGLGSLSILSFSSLNRLTDSRRQVTHIIDVEIQMPTADIADLPSHDLSNVNQNVFSSDLQLLDRYHPLFKLLCQLY